jgi:adenosylcobinamide-phosphate synthase
MRSRALGILLGYVADRAFADPVRRHPVAGFGLLATRLEQRLHADSRGRGALHVVVLAGGAASLGALAERATRHHPMAHVAVTAAATWAVLGGTSLDREAARVSDHLTGARLREARQQLTHLVGRDTRTLDEPEIARATIESVAENTSDAVVAPLLLGSLAGIPGLLGYRAANTLDAMVGHRSARYERFGWAAARLDDVLNLPGARLTALLATGLGDDPGAALRTWHRDAARHPSPNAGPVEASFAGALGVRLGGVNVYGSRVEDRHVLGDGRAPAQHDITRARSLAQRVGVAAAAVAVLIALRPRTRRRPPSRHQRDLRGGG